MGAVDAMAGADVNPIQWRVDRALKVCSIHTPDEDPPVAMLRGEACEAVARACSLTVAQLVRQLATARGEECARPR